MSRSLAFWPGPRQAAFTMSIALGAAVVVSAAPVAATTDPTQPQRWIAYQWDGSIMLIDINGNDGRILTTAPGVGEQLHPDWAPHGSALTFAVDDTDGTRDIWTASLDGSTAERIVDCSAPCAWTDDPAWSPDGKSIAFVRTVGDEDGDGTSTVDVVDVATGVSAVVVSTPTTWYPFVPRWSPSGQGIVYESVEFASAMLAEERVLSAIINVVDLMAPDPVSVAITDPSERATYADWSPNGEHIVFGLPLSPDQPDGPADLFIVEPTGGARTQLTAMAADGGRAIHPTWTPDGDGVVYVAEAVPFEEPTIAIVATDGTGSMTTVSGVNGTHPRLQPSPGGG